LERFTATGVTTTDPRSIHWARNGAAANLSGGPKHLVQTLVGQFTYAGIFAALLLSSLGVPLPEEVTIVSAGLLSHAGVVRWWLALPVCIAGVLSGDIVLYWAGRRWGPRILDWRPARRVLSPERLAEFEAAYRRRGAVIVFGARHVMGLRAAAFLAAGVVRVSFPRFLAADAAAALLGVPVSFTLAFLFSSQVWRILDDVRRVERWAALAALVAVVVWLGVRQYRALRRR
jgi:membrane protein DedA with SNARE-associated domain